MNEDRSNKVAGFRMKVGRVRKQTPEQLAGRVRPKRTIGRIILEHGVEMTWPYTGQPNEDQVGEDFRAYKAQVCLRPVLIQDRYTEEKGIETLLGTDGGSLSLVPEMFFIDGEDDHLYDQMTSVRYVLGAAVYHCQRLVNHYCCVPESIPDTHKSNHRVECCGCSDIYYEFDALMSSIRRAYDILKKPLEALSDENGGKPNTTRGPIRKNVWMPDSFAEVTKSWKERGNRIKEYRDCIQHHCPINTWLSTVSVERLECGRKKVVALIPDNPEDKSRMKFRYENRIDALTYGWEATSELFRIAILFANEIHERLSV